MGWIDIFIALVFFYNIIVGLTKGLLKSLFGIAAFVIAIILAPFFQGMATNIIANNFNEQQELTKILGLGFSWFFLYILLNIVASFVIKGMEKTPVKVLDRVAGLLVGLFMSIIIVIIPLLIIKSIPVVKDIKHVKESMADSFLLPLFNPVAAPLENAFKNALKEQREELMKKLKDKKGNTLDKLKKIQPDKTSKEEDIKKIMKEYDIKPLGSSDKNPKTKK